MPSTVLSWVSKKETTRPLPVPFPDPLLSWDAPKINTYKSICQPLSWDTESQPGHELVTQPLQHLWRLLKFLFIIYLFLLFVHEINTYNYIGALFVFLFIIILLKGNLSQVLKGDRKRTDSM